MPHARRFRFGVQLSSADSGTDWAAAARPYRDAIVQVVYDGQYTPGCGPIAPISPFFDRSRKCPTRDIARAKKLEAKHLPPRADQLRERDRRRGCFRALASTCPRRKIRER